MIGVLIFILLCIIVIEMFIAWLKYLLDETYVDDYEYCYKCNRGFCMEIPKSPQCLKWQEEKEDN